MNTMKKSSGLTLTAIWPKLGTFLILINLANS